jgi:putative hydrolase of the HAD superfamily
MGARMSEFVAGYLGLSAEQATEQRRHGLRKYGTTMSWLVHEHGLTDVEEFIDFVHPRDLDTYLTENDRSTAQSVFRELDIPASILTNAPREHADRVLTWLGISQRFDHIFDIRANSFQGKPARSAYEHALDTVGASAEATLFVDDVLQYVLAFRDMGGHAVHVSDEPDHEPGVTTISSLSDLVTLVEKKRRQK